MIWAQLNEKDTYRGIHPRLDKALDLLTEAFFETLSQTGEGDSLPSPGRGRGWHGEAVTGEGDLSQPPRVELEGNALYATRFDYETLPYEETFFEAHRQYLDIHVMLKGRERVEIAHPAGLEEFTHEGDFWGYHGAPEQSLLLEPGSFLVVFPGDAHRLKIAEGGVPEAVAKAVFKVLIDD